MAIDRDRIQDLWNQGEVQELARLLAGRRSEWSAHAVDRARAVPCAAALALLTLAETGIEREDPLLAELEAALTSCQDALGAWENPWTTALALRALAATGRAPAAFARGLAYLSSSQGPGGSWIAAEGEDLHDTAFVLTMLGDIEDFRHAVDVDRAVNWCEERRVTPGLGAGALLEAAEQQWAVAVQRIGTGPSVH